MSDSNRPDDERPGSDVDEAIRAEFDWSVTPPSRAVVETVAIAADREPTGIEPLYETIDPDALDTLIHPDGTSPVEGDTTVTFTLDCHQVLVQRDGTVVVQPAEASTESE